MPFQFSNETGTFDPSSDVYSNAEQYKNAVLKSSGANDLANPKNTSETNNPQQGDIILLKTHNNIQKYNHTQIISKVTSSQINIDQGNLDSRYLSDDPSSLFYSGQKIQEGVYYKGKNSYFNKSKIEYNSGDFLKENKSSIRTWNFNTWNK